MDRDNTLERETNPRQTANILSLVSFFYTIKLYIKGYTRGVELDDVYAVLPHHRSEQLGDNLEQQWQKEKEAKKSPSICRVLWISYGKFFLGIGFIQFVITMIITTWSPKALSKLIAYFSPGQTDLTKQDAIFYACLVIGINLVNTLVRYNFRLILQELGIRIKVALSSLLYRKSLKLTSESLSHVTAGKIVTIITKDVDTFEMFVQGGNSFWIAIVQAGLICYLIYGQIGVASFSGVSFFLVVLPLQVFIGILTYNYKLKCSKKSDERLDLIREVLSASKLIKMYTWEKFFENRIYTARKQELRKLHKLFYTHVWIKFIGSISSKTAFFIFLMTYIWMGNEISAETVYYVLSCCNDLENSLSNDIPSGFSHFAQLWATAERVESVLNAEELPPKQKVVESKNPKIILRGVDATIHETTVLENISITISGGLNIVVGHMGSGKTIFLKSILQECQISGDLSVSGRISYASQEPWLFPSTIKNNILFGEEYCQKRYQEVLTVCNLIYDLDLLSEGDDTVVGESGINLSKGQQARINLARAVYKDSDIYLLDDCLASLDAQVSDNIFKRCICNFLTNKLIILVSNNSDYLQNADRILEVASRSIKFSDKLEQVPEQSEEETDNKNQVKTEKANTKNIFQEIKKSGRVPLRDYLKYIEHGGGLIAFGLIVALFVLTQSTASYSDKVFSKWVTLEQNLTNYKKLNETFTPEYDNLYKERTQELSLYAVTVATSIIMSLIRSFSFFYFARMASIGIHKAMVQNIINSTMKFFDSHFIGNVINRFTKDCLTLDDTLPFVSMDCFSMIFIASGGIVVMTTVNYIFLIESIFLLIAACGVKQFCQPAGRNLERLHIIARSPINGHLNSTLDGLTTIRASNAQEILRREFDNHQNLFISAYFMVVTNFVSLSIFMKYVSLAFTGLIITQFLVTDFGGSVGDVGLVITQSFVITSIIASGLISVADCENLMVSVERVLEFTRLEEEDKEGKILIGWPKDGSLSFNKVSLNYGGSNKEMLSDITFAVNPKEKLGIVGRTGAGKSSIISSLFRLYQTQGTITIDGVDIKDVSLNWLRSNISVIPQDPYLFSGTIRENLDPLKQYTDEQIWKILKELKLDNIIDNLNAQVDKGLSFSAGQKQLLCLVRVILRKNKIVVLDEATANADHETEILMQEIIQKYFGGCTQIIVAHKPLSVMNCHKIMVLSNGRISRFDEPQNLLQNKNSFIQRRST